MIRKMRLILDADDFALFKYGEAQPDFDEKCAKLATH